MVDDSQPHRRRSVRLVGYRYARPGTCSVTVCTAGWRCILARLDDGYLDLTPTGRIVAEEWLRAPVLRPEVELDAFVVMPNHRHAVLVIGETASERGRVGEFHRPARSLGAVLAGFKSTTTSRVRRLPGWSGRAVWQRGYHEHIVRSEGALANIRACVADNPASWRMDRHNQR
ncbi:MAG: transposase [Armatimonadetes bacterium]|nr:transposase [Armatimonadota bacterium]